jgi:hypothetical protein
MDEKEKEFWNEMEERYEEEYGRGLRRRDFLLIRPLTRVKRNYKWSELPFEILKDITSNLKEMFWATLAFFVMLFSPVIIPLVALLTEYASAYRNYSSWKEYRQEIKDE